MHTILPALAPVSTTATSRNGSPMDPTLRLNYTARELLAMPREQRRAILEKQAELAAPEYEADLAKPWRERELTAFMLLNDIERVHDAEPEP